jgi:hypothetical protein
MSPTAILSPIVRKGLTLSLLLAALLASIPSAPVAAQGPGGFAETETPWTLPQKSSKRGDIVRPDAPSLKGAPLQSAVSGGQLVSVQEAQTKVNFKIRVPSSLPSGYSLKGAVAPLSLPANAPQPSISLPALPNGAPKLEAPQFTMLVFSNAAGEQLTLAQTKLIALPGAPTVNLPTGKGSVQTVTVSGRTGQYVEGRWTPNGWVASGMYQLRWTDADGITYDLTSTTQGLKSLLTVAESLK